MKNLSIITYIVGDTHSELLRTPQIINKRAEYLCITDNPSLRHPVWKCLYDPDLLSLKSPRDRMAFIKFNPFKYASYKHCLTIDGSYQINNSFDCVHDILQSHCMAVKYHPERISLYKELYIWRKYRHLPNETMLKFSKLLSTAKYPAQYKGLFETSIMMFNYSDVALIASELTLKLMAYLGLPNQLCITNQCPFTFIANMLFHNTKYITGFSAISNVIKCSHNKLTPIAGAQFNNSPYLYDTKVQSCVL